MMNRDEALEYVSGYMWWPKPNALTDSLPYAPIGWEWVDDKVGATGKALFNHRYGTITVNDWTTVREGIVKPTPTTEPDMVNHPPHYQSDNGIECIDAIRAALGRDGFIAYCRGNAIKYLWRNKVNNVEDRNKAIWYINRANAEETRG